MYTGWNVLVAFTQTFTHFGCGREDKTLSAPKNPSKMRAEFAELLAVMLGSGAV